MKPKTVKCVVPDYYSEELQLAILKSTEETIGKFLEDMPPSQRVITAVCKYFNTTLDEIWKPGRKPDRLYKRQVLFYFMKHYSSLTDEHIGILRKPTYDRVTVWHSSKLIQDMMIYPKTVKDLDEIRKLINLTTLDE